MTEVLSAAELRVLHAALGDDVDVDVSAIGAGATSIVFRAQVAGSPAALKWLRAGLPNAVDAARRFRDEANALARFDHPALVRVHRVGDAGDRPYLLMELVEGEALEDRLHRGPLNEQELVRLGRDIASALALVHRRGVLHRDLKPANVLLPRGATGASGKVIDFGFAGGDDDDGAFVGTFLYAAPEQLTGGSVDARADLYALGALLFECATGFAPFCDEGDASLADVLERHARGDVPNAHAASAEVAPSMALVLSRLLAKDANDRYQSADGFLYDWARLADIDTALRGGATYALGAGDRVRARGENRFVGRRAELDRFTRLVDAVRNGGARAGGAVVVVDGEPGVGKTRLLREAADLAQQQGALVLRAKGLQQENAPLAAVRDAIDGAGLDAARIASAAGDAVSVLRRLSPRLQELFASAPDPPALDAAAERDRLLDRAVEFLLALGRQERGVAIVVDDIDAADAASRDVLCRVARRCSESPIVVVVSGSAQASAALAVGEDAWRLSLGGLDVAAVAAYAAGELGAPVDEDAASKVHARSRGVALGVVEYVRAFIDEGVFVRRDDGFGVDDERLAALAPPADVVDLVVGRVAQLDAQTLSVLQTIALVGVDVDRAVVDAVVGGDISAALAEGVRLGLVENIAGRVRFAHPRVATRLKASIGAREQALHQSIADAAHRAPDSPALISVRATHGAAGVVDDHAARVFAACVAAGRQELASFSAESAHRHLSAARTILERHGLDVDASARRRLLEELGTAAVRSGRHAEGRGCFEAALAALLSASPQSRVDRGRLLYLLGDALALEGKNNVAAERYQEGLAALGAPLPPRSQFERARKVQAGLARLREWSGFGFGRASAEERKRRQLISAMHNAIKILFYFLGDLPGMQLIAVRELNNAHALGAGPDNAKAHIGHAWVVALQGDRAAVAHHGKRALDMAKASGDQEALAFCRVNHCYALEFAGQNVESQAAIAGVIDDIVRYTPAADASRLMLHVGHSMVFQGRARNAITWCFQYLPLMKQLGGTTWLIGFHGILFSQLSMVGRTAEALEMKKGMDDLAALVPNVKHARAMVCLHTVSALLDQEDFGAELDARCEEFVSLDIQDYHRRYGYALVAYARAEQVDRAANDDERKRALARFAALLALPAFRPLEVCPVHRTHLRTLAAMLARFEGRPAAVEWHKEAVELARAALSPWGLFAAHRERARAARAANNEVDARAAATDALAVARDEGWRDRAAQVQREFGVAARGDVKAVDANAEAASRDRALDAILRVALASASSINALAQAKAALDELVSVLGAERAALMVHEPGDGAAPGANALRLFAARDSDQKDVDFAGYSTTVLAKVAAERRPLIFTGNNVGEIVAAASVVAHNLRSIIASPVMLRDELLGVVYLDSRVAKSLFRAEQLSLLQAICNHIAIGMEAARLARAESQRREFEKDLELTAAVQRFFLPSSTSADVGIGRVVGMCRPAGHCSGDWWTYEKDRDGGAIVVVGDVTGHGAPSAMLTAYMASHYRAVRDLLPAFDGAKLLQQLHIAVKDVGRSEYMIATTALQLRTVDGRKRAAWWLAGAPPFFVMKKDGKVELVQGRSSHIGGDGALTLSAGERDVDDGDRIFLFTDGAFEIQTHGERQLGLAGLKKILASTRDKDVDGALAHIANELDTLLKKHGKTLADDDITLTLVDV
jgi:serine phosphatase RsbU (regulator of sigma subunit)/tRNA A-37 threonylcarbamoyl transferase component Bud32